MELPRKTTQQRERAARLYRALERRYPDAQCALNWSKPHELLIATILSAQATDVSVNKATPALFGRYPTPADFASCKPEDLEPFLKTLNFWRNKSKAVVEAMKRIHREFGGRVPSTMEELLTLRGVARKTANVVLSNAFGLNEGVVVDTHVGRIAQRFALSKASDPAKIELDLMALFPTNQWGQLSHLLIAHGRAVCKARGHSCGDDLICREFSSEAGRKKVRSPSTTRRG